MSSVKGFKEPNLNSSLIGRVVTIQVFKRKSSAADEILPDSLEKYVGTLESYYTNKDGFMFRLVGGERVFVVHAKQHIEFFT